MKEEVRGYEWGMVGGKKTREKWKENEIKRKPTYTEWEWKEYKLYWKV